MKNAPLRSYKTLKNAKITENVKISKFDQLPLKNYVRKKSRKKKFMKNDVILLNEDFSLENGPCS